ncbi:VOC family protein [Olivibacter sp. CPCC 100613]|uniref:VOC family protein n=1 Tax=Olivibacter sp. CPCC 100613 TaxID=3079931 RepID=UPI002FFADD6A
MLQNNQVFGSYSTDDLGKAEAFYKDTLGLGVVRAEMGVLELHLKNDHTVIIYPKENHSPATFTVLNFVVEDIVAMVNQLTTKGIQFISYTGEIQTDKNGIANADGSRPGPKIAWFTDPAGNILSILEEST